MKVEFYCDSGANKHSCKKQILDTVDDLGLDEGQWEKLDDDDKLRLAEVWAQCNGFVIGFREIEP